MTWKKSVTWLAVILFAAPFVIHIVPQMMGLDAFIVESNSMKPDLEEGDILYVETSSEEKLEKGDVIIFEPSNWSSEDLVAHRIVDKRNENNRMLYKTKGDNNLDADPGWISRENVLGEKAYSIPFLGYIVSGAHSLYFVILLILLPSGILIKSEIEKILSETS